MALLLVLIGSLLLLAPPALAGPTLGPGITVGPGVKVTGVPCSTTYFNATECSCNDATILFCDDFEDGTWYVTNADTDGGEFNPINNGWEGTIYWTSVTYGAAVCGGVGAVGSRCAATRDYVSGIGSGNIAKHWFSPNKRYVDEFWARWYIKTLPGYVYGHEKMLFIQGDTGNFQCCLMKFPFGSNLPALEFLGGASGYYVQNQGVNIGVDPGKWYYLEIHLKLNTWTLSDGVFEMWIDDCGTDGLGCTGPGTLRAQHFNIPDLRYLAETSSINNLHLENWANPESVGDAYYDEMIVATRRVGPKAVPAP